MFYTNKGKIFFFSNVIDFFLLFTMNSTHTDVITAEILINPFQLHAIQDYVDEKLSHLEKHIFSTEHGYIDRILSKKSISFVSTCFATHDGSMIFEVKFNALCTNPQPNDIVQCIIFLNEDIMVGVSGPMHILIKNNNDDYSKSIKKNDKVMVCVIKTGFDIKKNVIRVLANLIQQ